MWSALIVVFVLLATYVHLPYLAVAPGSATSVSDLFSAPADHSYPPNGQIYLTTVSLIGLPHSGDPAGLRPLEALRGWLDDDIAVYREEVILGTTPADKVIEQNQAQMSDSQLLAKLVAFDQLGYDIQERGDGGRVLGVDPEAPAAGKLEDQDVIVAVDGTTTTTADQIISLIRGHAPGETIQLTIEREGAPRRLVEINLGDRASDGGRCYVATGGTGLPCLGVGLSTRNQSFNFPFEVNIDAGRIGGPSAGLAFTLGLIDYLTPGELTGGHRIAVTGTIGADGAVGEVGGVAQKTAAAIARGAEYFLVPMGELDMARKRAGSKLEVIGVATIEDALQVLKGVGGDLTAVGPVGQGAGR